MADSVPTASVQPVAGRRIGPPTPRVALVIVGAIVLGAVLYLGRSALAPFVIGLVLAYLLDVPVERLSRLRVPRWLSILVVYVVVVAALVQAIRLALRPLADEVAAFIAEVPDFVARIADQYADLDLPPTIREAIDGLLDDLASGAGEFDPSVFLPVVTGVAGMLGAIVGYIIIPVWMFYLIKDKPALAEAAESALPPEWRADVRAIVGLATRVFGQWLRGQFLLGLTVGVATFGGLLFLSVTVDPIFGRFAIVLAVVAGVFELLPVIGPILSAIPAVLLGLTAGIEPAVAALVLYFVIQQLENNILVPKIQGDAVELHPSVIMVALVVGAAIAGLLGAILALPIAAAGRDVFRYLFHRLGDPPAEPAEAIARIRARPTIIETDEEDLDPDAAAAAAVPTPAAAEPDRPE